MLGALRVASAPAACLLITRDAGAFMRHDGPAWLYMPGPGALPGLRSAPNDLPLSASTTSLLPLPTRHLMFDYPLQSLPAEVLSPDMGEPLLLLGPHPVISRLQHVQSCSKIIQTLPFTAFHFDHTEQEEGLYLLCLSALGLADPTGREVFSYTRPAINMRRSATPSAMRLDLSGGIMALGLSASVLLFGLALLRSGRLHGAAHSAAVAR